MRSLVIHPATGLVLDFEAEDFGGADQEAIIADWLARRAAGRSGRLVDPGEFICYRHRNHEHPDLYLAKRYGQIIAAHWQGSGLAHEIVHAGITPQHERQREYIQRAGEDAGHRSAAGPRLASGNRVVIPDAVIYGPQVDMGVEVQRSHLTAARAKSRTTSARHAGVLPVWFSDSKTRPRWLEQVPGVVFGPDQPWLSVPPPRSVTVVSGVRQVVERRCRTWTGPANPCPEHSRGCTRWHPDHEALPLWADELPAYVPAAKLVPMVFRTFSGRQQVFIVRPDDKERYEVMVGHTADLPPVLPADGRVGQGDRVECAANAGGLARDLAGLTPAQQETALELPWYRAWLMQTPQPEQVHDPDRFRRS
jgi:hypothetical protein